MRAGPSALPIQNRQGMNLSPSLGQRGTGLGSIGLSQPQSGSISRMSPPTNTTSYVRSSVPNAPSTELRGQISFNPSSLSSGADFRNLQTEIRHPQIVQHTATERSSLYTATERSSVGSSLLQPSSTYVPANVSPAPMVRWDGKAPEKVRWEPQLDVKTPPVSYNQYSGDKTSLSYNQGHYVQDPYAPGESTYVIPNINDPNFNPYNPPANSLRIPDFPKSQASEYQPYNQYNPSANSLLVSDFPRSQASEYQPYLSSGALRGYPAPAIQEFGMTTTSTVAVTDFDNTTLKVPQYRPIGNASPSANFGNHERKYSDSTLQPPSPKNSQERDLRISSPRDPTAKEPPPPQNPCDRLRALLGGTRALAQASFAAFESFDEDQDRRLNENELYNLVAWVSKEFGFPVPTVGSVREKMAEWDGGKGSLSPEDFAPLYGSLLREMLVTLESQGQQQQLIQQPEGTVEEVPRAKNRPPSLQLPVESRGGRKRLGSTPKLMNDDISPTTNDSEPERRSRRNSARNEVRREWFVGKQPGSAEQHYEFVKKIGHGAFGVVHLVRRWQGGETRVCKTIDKELAAGAANIEEEITQLQLLDHPNIIRLLEYYEDYKNVYIILDTAKGGDLEELLCHVPRRVAMTEALLANVLRQVLHAVSYCHGKNVIHKDLKPANIMLLTEDYTNPQVVVVDFGLAELLHGPGTTGASGTPGFVAPEVWAASVGIGSYSPKCDVYSCGAILFWGASGARLPWWPQGDDKGSSIAELAPKFLKAFERPPELEFQGVFCGTALAKDLAMQMLSRNDKYRPEAAQCLKHPWLIDPKLQGVPLDEDNLRALARNANRNSVQRLLLLECATLIPPCQLAQINATFQALDTDFDGILTTSELAAALRGLGIDDGSADSIVRALDSDKDGRIEYSEFLTGLVDRCTNQFQDALWSIFCKYDTSGTGFLELPEFERLLQEGHLLEAGVVSNHDEALRLLKEMDMDGDGRISFDELVRSMMPQNAMAPTPVTRRLSTVSPAQRTSQQTPRAPYQGMAAAPCDNCVIS